MNFRPSYLCFSSLTVFVFLMVFLLPCPALAVRPFITDDARVVGGRSAQLETSVRIDRTRAQNLNLFAFGLTENWEGTVGWTDGYFLEGEDSWKLSVAGPLLQLKYLFTPGKPNSYPGFALVGGAVAPWGTNNFGNPSWGEYVYAALTESLFEQDRVMVHGNLGAQVLQPDGGQKAQTILTWGLGVQVRVIGGLHSVSEIFSGDPYAETPGGAYQVGFRYFISENMQVDATIGGGLWGEPKLDTFFGFGLRIVWPNVW